MTAFATKLDNAAAGATCAALQVGGSALIGYGAVGLAAGGTGIVPIAAGSLALMASELGCTWDPAGPGPDPGGAPIDYCAIGASPSAIWTFTNGINTNVTAEVAVITKFDFTNRETDPSGYFRDYYDFRGTTPQGAAYRTELVLALGLDDESYFEQRFSGDPLAL